MSRTSRMILATLGLTAAVTLALPSTAYAQRHGHVHGAVVVGGPYYSPYYYPGFYSWYGWGYPYGSWGYPPYYYWPRYDNTGSARLDVTPSTAEVFIDGYYAGVVDEFDGTFQRLHIQAGEHEIAFYQDGYQTVRQRVLFRRDGTLKLAFALQPLQPGQTSERPVPDPAAAASNAPARTRQAGPPPPRYRGQAAPDMDPGQPSPPGAAQEGAFGTLSIRIQPGDAEVVIDGQRWEGSDAGARLEVQLIEGAHRIDVHKDGYRPYTANLRIRRGATETLNVSLTQQEPQRP